METTALIIGYSILAILALAIVVFAVALIWIGITEARGIINTRKWRKRKLSQMKYETGRDCANYLLNVKKLYADALDASNSPHEPDDRKWGNYRVALLEKLFGIHNLTSDAEEEEMLTVSRKEIQQLVSANDELIKKYPGRDSIEAIQAKTVSTILNRLFGSKCLPDEEPKPAEPNVDSSHDNVDSSEVNVDSLEYLEPKANSDYIPIPEKTVVSKWDKTEPNPDGLNEDNFAKSEPKFKVGDIVTHKNSPHIWRCITAIMPDGTYVLDGEIYNVEESDLEPYTEPEENIAENPNLSKDCDKHFDTILKDSFSKECRLNISATIMTGVLTNPNIIKSRSEFKSISENWLASRSLELADALITEYDTNKLK